MEGRPDVEFVVPGEGGCVRACGGVRRVVCRAGVQDVLLGSRGTKESNQKTCVFDFHCHCC